MANGSRSQRGDRPLLAESNGCRSPSVSKRPPPQGPGHPFATRLPVRVRPNDPRIKNPWVDQRLIEGKWSVSSSNVAKFGYGHAHEVAREPQGSSWSLRV